LATNETAGIDISYHRYFSAGSAALRVISHAIRDASVVRNATAYFEPSGYQCLREDLRGKEIRILLGRPDAGADKIREVLQEFFKSLSEGPVDDRTRAMEELRAALENGLFQVAVSIDDTDPPTTMGARYLYQHAKLYIADHSTAVVSSSNFTRHGLTTSREAGLP
jgi:phosphatidylserine/phosphatidylglycerophosphate/cardiolipin synthase-like enzyme